MDPLIIGAGISALANLGGGIMSAGGAAAQNAAAQQRNQNEMSMFMRQNDLNQWYFAKNFENQQYMSNTAYQRAMADMKAAGLNPILAYQQGGANANAGGMQSAAGGHLSDPMPSNPGGEMGRAVGRASQSALDAATTIQGIENAKATQALTNATAMKTAVDTKKSEAETLQTLEQTNLTKGQIQQLEHQKNLLLGQTASAHASAAHSHSAAALNAANTDIINRFGKGTAAELADTAEKTARRLTGSVSAGAAAGPVPRAVPKPGKYSRPFTGLRNE